MALRAADGVVVGVDGCRRRLVTVVVLVAVVGLVGCSPANQGAVTLDAATGRPALVTALCEGEGIVAVRLAEATSGAGHYEQGATIWRIEAQSGQRLSRIVVGEVPDGFVVTVALDGADLPAEMVLAAESDGGGRGIAGDLGGFFVRDELQAGVLVQGQTTPSEGDLARHARANCSRGLFAQLGLPPWLDWIALGLLVTLAAAAGGLVMRSARRRRSVARTG
jgi:hypothetical protein